MQLKTPPRASSDPAPGAAPRSSARAFASRCLPPPGNPPASWLAPFASERGAEGTGPMGVGDSAGCGCQGRGPNASIPPARRRRRRLGVWTLMPPVGRVWRRRAAHRDPAGTGQAAEGRAGVSRVGVQEGRPGSGPQAGRALCTPRVA